MVNHNHYTSLVLLALFVLGAFVVLGVLAVSGPFGPGQEVKGIVALTQSGLKVRGTESALSAMETPQAIQAGQAAAVAQLTAMPPAQTATQIAAEASYAMDLQGATQTVLANQADTQRSGSAATQIAIAQDVKNQELANAVTQTAIAIDLNSRIRSDEATQVAIGNAQYQEKLSIDATATAMTRNGAMENVKGIAVIALLIAVAGGAILGFAVYATVKLLRARALEIFARARLIKERRQPVKEQTQPQKYISHLPVNQSKITTIQVKRPDNLRDLPRAE